MACNWLRCAWTLATGMSGAASTRGGAAAAAGAAATASATVARETRSLRMVGASSRVRRTTVPSVQDDPAGDYGRKSRLIPVLPIRTHDVRPGIQAPHGTHTVITGCWPNRLIGYRASVRNPGSDGHGVRQ